MCSLVCVCVCVCVNREPPQAYRLADKCCNYTKPDRHQGRVTPASLSHTHTHTHANDPRARTDRRTHRYHWHRRTTLFNLGYQLCDAKNGLLVPPVFVCLFLCRRSGVCLYASRRQFVSVLTGFCCQITADCCGLKF